MNSIITAALTAARVPDDYSEENCSSLITPILCLFEERELLGWRFSGIFYRQRARQNSSKQPSKVKSLKRQIFQQSSNLHIL